ncbi:MAG TPA: tetratricopeptide repeat protein [Candidatus Krumholzibacteria bacterium]|nr:tetratricopeptide repeat protein [Candidatus Krumholzibacteria bacterium]
MKLQRHAVTGWLLAGLLLGVSAGGAYAQDGENPRQEQAMQLFAAGVLLLEQGHADQAVDPLSQAWRLSERNPTVGERLAEAYYSTRDVARADQIATEVLKANPSSIEMLHMKARLSLARGDLRGAIGFLERARAAAPGSIDTERMLATLYAENGDTDHAIEALEHCIKLEPDVPELHVAYGEMLVSAGRTTEAEAAFKSALELDPGDASAVENLVDLYQSQQRKDDAIAVLEAYAAQPDATPAARMRLAQAYADAGREKDAISLLESARKDGQTSDDADLLLGRMYFEAGRYDDAKQVFLSLYQKSSASPELARILGDLSLKTGDVAGARTYFDKAIALNPDDYRSYLALFFAQSKRFTQEGARIEMSPRDAADVLAHAASKAPRGDVDAQFSLGMAYSSIDSLTEAGEHLARASELEPERQDVLFNLASVYEKQARYPDAERTLIELYRLAPDDAAVCNFYGYLLAVMNKDLDRAEKLVRHALEKEPDNAYYVDSLGWVYYQRGDYAAAVTQLERAVKLVGEDPVILEHLGDAYSGLSRFKDALAAYQHSSRLQESNPKLREKIQSTQRRLQ